MRLTKRMIDRAEYEGTGKSRHVLWDDDPRGLGLRVYPTGRKSFVLSYRTAGGGRKRLMTLGAYGVLTLTQARRLAREQLVEVMRGEDPVGERRAASEAVTVSELAELYIEGHAKPRKKTWREDDRYIRVDISPAIGHLRAEEVTRVDVRRLHATKGKAAPYAANRAIEVVQMMFKWGEREGHLPRGHLNPAKGITPHREVKRERFVQPSEVPALARAIDNLEHVYARSAIWLYLLTGARKQEILRAKWDQVDLEAATLHLPDTKNGRPHTIPLSSQAAEVIEAIPRQMGSPFMFCGQRTGKPLACVQWAWVQVREAAGLPDVRLHDLRRTVGSWMAMDGVPLLVIGKTLNHTSHASTLVYARLNNDPVRAALEDHGARLMAARSEEE